jgi:EpsD family peptidyl-prolyl cis-trans isomerase
MKRFRILLLAPLVAVTLGGCHFPHFGNKTQPVGQVVATVDGQEITVRELNAELAGVTVTDPKQRKLAEQYALRAIIARKILAAAARKQGIDKTPDFAMLRDRAVETLLAQALAAKVASAVPPTSQEEALSFVTAHPNTFAERKIFTVDQILTGKLDPTIVAALKPLNTMDSIQALFDQNHIQYRRGTGELDALALDPSAVDAIVKLPAGSAFILPNGNNFIISAVKQTRSEPFTGTPAINFAMEMLRRQHSQQAVSREVSADLNKGAALVRYNKDYAPPPAKPAAPASNTAAK